MHPSSQPTRRPRARIQAGDAVARLAVCGCLMIAAAACGGGEVFDFTAAPGTLPELRPTEPHWLHELAASANREGSTGARRPRPHVILVSLDTLRADHLGAWGYRRPTSPFLDALAAGGTRFANTFSHSPKTAPSHMSVFTGAFPFDHGAHFQYTSKPPTVFPVRADLKTLPEIMRDAGYRTAAWTGGGQVAARAGFARGFESFRENLGTIDPRKTQEIRRWFRRHAAAPVFLFIHTYQIHDPYLPPPPYGELFADPAYAGWVEGRREHLSDAANADFDTLHKAFWRKTGEHVDTTLIGPEDRQRLTDLYDGGIRYTDDVLRGLFTGLFADGLLEDTLVVVFSDHGEEFLEHGGVLHEKLYRETLHVPLIFFAPGRVPAARVVTSQVGLMDLAPTLLELAGLTPPPTNARSLAPLIMEQAEPTDRAVFSEAPWCHPEAHHRSLRAAGRMLYDHDGGRIQLFDTVVDPAELDDLAERRPESVEALRDRLQLVLEVRSLAAAGPGESARELSDAEIEALRALGYLE